jgi:hypothetical protein
LVKLNLSNTQVTGIGLEHLRGLTNLQNLVLTETNVTKVSVERLKKALPACRIVTSPRLQ